MSNSETQAFPSPKQILGSGMDYHEIQAKPGLSKLEYALIHSTWEPSEDQISSVYSREKGLNPYNEPNKPPLSSRPEIIRTLKINHFKKLLDHEQ